MLNLKTHKDGGQPLNASYSKLVDSNFQKRQQVNLQQNQQDTNSNKKNQATSIQLAKLLYFTNLGFPEIRGFPLLSTIWGEVVWGRYNLTRSKFFSWNPSAKCQKLSFARDFFEPTSGDDAGNNDGPYSI